LRATRLNPARKPGPALTFLQKMGGIAIVTKHIPCNQWSVRYVNSPINLLIKALQKRMEKKSKKMVLPLTKQNAARTFVPHR